MRKKIVAMSPDIFKVKFVSYRKKFTRRAIWRKKSQEKNKVYYTG